MSYISSIEVLPEGFADQDQGKWADFVALDEGRRFEHLVEGAEAARQAE